MAHDSLARLSARDLSALQGTWEQVAHEIGGIANARDEYGAPGALTTFEGTHFTVRTAEGTLMLEGTFVIDASTNPKSITWIDSIGDDAGKHLPASYILDGDNFVFIAADEGRSRPTVFRTELGQVMRTFVRCR